jgi:hypothetical protein
MKTQLRTILSVAILSAYGFAFVGCNNASKPITSAPPSSDQDHDHDHADGDHDHAEGDHDHDGHDHAGHDHPEHGIRGGHMVELSNGSKTEVQLSEDTDLFSVYVDDLGEISKVQMKTTIADKETVYEFERSDTPAGPVYGLKSPELATAVKMGKEVVQTELLITTADGDLTAQYEHHSH